jgi:cell division protease FtsH
MEFRENMLYTQEVSHIQVINKEKVEVYIKENALTLEKYEDVAETPFLGTPNPGPHYTFSIGSIDVFEENMAEAQRDLLAEDWVDIRYDYQDNWFNSLWVWILPIFMIILFWNLMIRRSGGGFGGKNMFNFGSSTATVFNASDKSKVSFEDVAGLEEAKMEVREIVDFLKTPENYTKLGGKIPKGVILVGPPGTGKTLLAKAVAGEAQVPFFSLSGSEFVEMFVGVGASRVRDLFKKAKEKSPSIIFIDEIDAIGRSRGKVQALQTNDERENTLNQLLTEMDGFEPNTGVIVLAATNRADILDHALLRPGRFDRHIYLELPNMIEREQIFKVHLRPLILSSDIEVHQLAAQTPGFSGADIANICNEAALIAARNKKEQVQKDDFNEAIDRVIGGLERKSKILSKEEKTRVAYHEAGHATVSWMLPNADPLIKVSIVPRGKSLGAAWYLPEEHQLITKSEFQDKLCAALAGRAAEEITFGEVSSGALDDLEKVTKQAYTMVVYYGLNEKIGNLSFYDSSGEYERSLQKPYSEATAQLIDEEVRKLVGQAYNKTKNLLEKNQDKLAALANQLLRKEVVYRSDLEKILGKRNKHISNTAIIKGIDVLKQ